MRYLVAGGVAVNGYGYLRFTKDLDLVVQLVSENLRRALEALSGIGYRLKIPVSIEDAANLENLVAWQRDKNMVVMQLWSDRFLRTPIDIFITEPFDFERAYAEAPVEELAPGVTARLVPLNDLIAMKRLASRESDLLDVQNLERLRHENCRAGDV